MSVSYWSLLNDKTATRFLYGATYGAVWGGSTTIIQPLAQQKPLKVDMNLAKQVGSSVLTGIAAGGLAQIGTDYVGKVIYDLNHKNKVQLPPNDRCQNRK